MTVATGMITMVLNPAWIWPSVIMDTIPTVMGTVIGFAVGAWT